MNEYKLVSAPLVLILNTVPLSRTAVGAGKERYSRAIEIAVAALHQPGMGFAPSLPPVKEYKMVSTPLVLILNTVP